MADTAGYQTPKPQFDIGRVVSRTFSAIKNNFKTFFLASLIIMGVPMFLIGLWPVFLGAGGMYNGAGINEAYVASMFVIAGITMLVTLIGGVILQGALIHGAIEDFNGRKADFRECFSVAIRYFFPLLGLAILVFIGVMLGFLLFIIPGLLVALGWFVSAPAMLVEGKGITDSISRSWELTKGYKRWILLLLVMFVVVSAIIGAVLGLFTLIAGDPTTVMIEGGNPMFHFLNAIFSAISQALSSMISAIGAAAIYYELRQIKEGIGAESLATIFD